MGFLQGSLPHQWEMSFPADFMRGSLIFPGFSCVRKRMPNVAPRCRKIMLQAEAVLGLPTFTSCVKSYTPPKKETHRSSGELCCATCSARECASGSTCYMGNMPSKQRALMCAAQHLIRRVESPQWAA